jgi:hypothetical protein
MHAKARELRNVLFYKDSGVNASASKSVRSRTADTGGQNLSLEKHIPTVWADALTLIVPPVLTREEHVARNDVRDVGNAS